MQISAVEQSSNAGHVVLVVDDEPTVRALVKRVLERAGYSVLLAVDGSEAVRVAGAHGGAIDVLLTDVVMPGMDGSALRDALRVKRPGLRVLFMSGYTPDLAFRREVGAAAGRFLPKPFTSAQLLSALRDVLDAPPPSA